MVNQGNEVRTKCVHMRGESVFLCVFVQVEAAKKTYHMACKEEKVASIREATIKAEASVTAEQQKKIHEKVDKCKQDSQKVRAPGCRRSHGPYGNVGVQK